MGLMDTTSIEARKKKEAVMRLARNFSSAEFIMPTRGGKMKYEINGTPEYVVFEHNTKGQDNGSFQIYLVDKNGKHIALAMKQYSWNGNPNKETAWKVALTTAVKSINNWANKQ